MSDGSGNGKAKIGVTGLSWDLEMRCSGFCVNQGLLFLIVTWFRQLPKQLSNVGTVSGNEEVGLSQMALSSCISPLHELQGTLWWVERCHAVALLSTSGITTSSCRVPLRMQLLLDSERPLPSSHGVSSCPHFYSKNTGFLNLVTGFPCWDFASSRQWLPFSRMDLDSGQAYSSSLGWTECAHLGSSQPMSLVYLLEISSWLSNLHLSILLWKVKLSPWIQSLTFLRIKSQIHGQPRYFNN